MKALGPFKLILMVTSLLVGYSHEQGPPPDILGRAYPSPQPTPFQRQSRLPSQQVILPGGFQHPFYGNQFPNIGTSGNSQFHSPFSVQNQQFSFPSRNPFSIGTRLPSTKPTSSRNLPPPRNPGPPRPPRLPSQSTKALPPDYEYYDETERDFLSPSKNFYPSGPPPSAPAPTATDNRKNVQYFTELSPPKPKGAQKEPRNRESIIIPKTPLPPLNSTLSQEPENIGENVTYSLSSSSLSSDSKRPLLKNSTGNDVKPSHPPLIIRPKNLTKGKRVKEISTNSSSNESPNDQTNSLPSVEDYTVEYVDYPFNNEDNSSILEYYQVSEETAQALLHRAKTKAKKLNHNLKPNSTKIATKVTVSVSSKSTIGTTAPSDATETPDNMPAGAETAPEYSEEEYTYPDNYPVLNNEQGSSSSQKEEEKEEEQEGNFSGNEFSHEMSIPSPTNVAFEKENDEETYDEAVQPQPSTSAPSPPPSTEKPKDPVINLFSNIKFAEISPEFLPPGFKLPGPSGEPEAPKTSTTTTTTTTTAKPEMKPNFGIQFQEIDISSLLPKGYKPRPTFQVSSTPSTSTTEKPVPPSAKPIDPLEAIKSIVKFEEVIIPGLIPKDYSPPPTSNFSDPIKFEFPANLLPPGYKPPSDPKPTEEKPVTPSTTRKPGGLVFPTKPGGARVTRPSSTEPPKGDTPPPPEVRIATGWPTKKSTPFTGWPTTPTTPMPSTSSTSTTTTPAPSTTTKATTTTTTPPPKRSPLGSCPQGTCRLEATIRIAGGLKWTPEFLDVNTDEYKNLEIAVKRELDGAYRSSGLAPWYRKIEIEGFNRGSVIVDYFLLLDGVDRDLSTDFVVRQFHKSLLDSADELPFYDESDSPHNLMSNGRLRFGRYSIDPRYTDFKVVNITKGTKPLAQDPWIPQWGIAVIVIGLASLLFIIIFAVTVLINRHKSSKKNAVLTKDMLNEFNKSHMASGGAGLDNYGVDDLANDDMWNERQTDRTFDRRKRSQGQSSANYNIYDSWKTEWNGYYYNGAYYGDSGYAPGRRRLDYDTSF